MKDKIKRIFVLVVIGMFIAMMPVSVVAECPEDWTIGGDAFGGSTTQDLGTTTADDLRIITGGGGPNERMRITSGGNIGIRTASPGQLLQLGGSDTSTTGIMRFEASDGDEVDLGITTNDEFYITGGNVGIGTTTPTLGRLQLDTAPAASCALYIANPMGMAVDNGAINIGGRLFIDEDEIQSAVGRTLYINNDNDVDLIINNGGGKVGIGVTSPAQELEIDGNILIHAAAGRAISMETPSSDLDGYDFSMHSGNAYDLGGATGNDGGDLYLRGGNGDCNLLQATGGDGGNVYLYGGLKEGNGANGDVILAHTSSAIRGKVGIGTTTPANPLEIFSATSVQFRITNTAAADYATFGVDSTGQLDIITYDGSGNDANLCLMPDGDVGIQTIAPLTTLHIAGDVAFGAGSSLTPDGDDEITVTHSFHSINTAGGDDALDTINGYAVAGQILILFTTGGNTLTVVDDDSGAGNNIILDTSNDFAMDDEDTLTLLYNGSYWLELSRSVN